MAVTLDDLITSIREQRAFFLKHLEDARDEQWDWKPAAGCKSIRETLVHLIGNDRASIQTIESGQPPDFETIYAEPERDVNRLRALLAETLDQLCDFLKTNYADAPLETEVFYFLGPMKLRDVLILMACEHHYHAGQVAYIRMATDPSWDYYAAIFGYAE